MKAWTNVLVASSDKHRRTTGRSRCGKLMQHARPETAAAVDNDTQVTRCILNSDAWWQDRYVDYVKSG